VKASRAGVQKPPGGQRFIVLIGVLATACAGQVTAAETPPSSSSVASPSCVDVSINQHAVLAFDCLSRALGTGAKQPVAPSPMLDAVANEPSNRQVGQYNFSALSHRMGSNLGKSVIPQRPPVVAPAPPAVQLAPGH